MTIVFILAAILMFGILIAVHEFGHFAAAKLCGVRVNEFSIGMGPAIWTRQRGETQYSLRALPSAGTAPWREKMKTPAMSGPSPGRVSGSSSLFLPPVH